MISKLQEGVITFDASLKEEMLSYFGKTIDQEGYIIEKDNPEQRVITPDGELITLEDFAGIRKGSEIYLKSDVSSLIKLLDTLR